MCVCYLRTKATTTLRTRHKGKQTLWETKRGLGRRSRAEETALNTDYTRLIIVRVRDLSGAHRRDRFNCSGRHTHTHTHTRARTRSHTHTRTHAQTHTHGHTRTHTRTQTQTHTDMCMDTRTHAYTHTHGHTRTHTHTMAHTQMHVYLWIYFVLCNYIYIHNYLYKLSITLIDYIKTFTRPLINIS